MKKYTILILASIFLMLSCSREEEIDPHEAFYGEWNAVIDDYKLNGNDTTLITHFGQNRRMTFSYPNIRTQLVTIEIPQLGTFEYVDSAFFKNELVGARYLYKDSVYYIL